MGSNVPWGWVETKECMGILLALRGFLLSCTRSEPLIAVSAGQIFALVLTFRSPAACSEIARLRDCESARLRERESARLREREIARLREREIARARDCEIVRARGLKHDPRQKDKPDRVSRSPARTRGLKPLRGSFQRRQCVASSREDAGIETAGRFFRCRAQTSRPPARTHGLKRPLSFAEQRGACRVLPRGRGD